MSNNSLPGQEICYRGSSDILKNSIVITLPSTSLLYDDWTVQLTAQECPSKILWTSGVVENKFTVNGHGKFFWHVVGSRKIKS
jgi:hypothetical protein